MNEVPIKEDLIFMFSKTASANKKIGESIVLDDAGLAHSFTAAFRHDTIKRFDWSDKEHVITLELAAGEEPRVVKMNGAPENQGKWQEWGYNPK